MNAHNFIDRSGQRFGSITILRYVCTDFYRKPKYLWRCDSGTERITVLTRILYGKTTSCGCKNIENHTTHNMSNSRIYSIWQNVKNRTTNPKSTQWKYYGGRGIKMCNEWLNSFQAFASYMGNPPSEKHSIDRFPDNNGNYEPGNVRWATHSEQSKNRRKRQSILPEPPKQ